MEVFFFVNNNKVGIQVLELTSAHPGVQVIYFYENRSSVLTFIRAQAVVVKSVDWQQQKVLFFYCCSLMIPHVGWKRTGPTPSGWGPPSQSLYWGAGSKAGQWIITPCVRAGRNPGSLSPGPGQGSVRLPSPADPWVGHGPPDPAHGSWNPALI